VSRIESKSARQELGPEAYRVQGSGLQDDSCHGSDILKGIPPSEETWAASHRFSRIQSKERLGANPLRFQVKPQNEVLIRPSLPESIARLSEIALNVVWSWDHNIRAIFRRLDPVLWRATGRNPVLMLSRLSGEALEKAAADPRFLGIYRRTCARFDAYVQRPEPADHPDRLIAYFCMEFGIVDCMPTYSGGLGVLSGDHLKAASDLDLPLCGIGLLYQKGYLRQLLNPDGWQQERYPVNDFYLLPIEPVIDARGADLTVHVDMAGQDVEIRVWRMNVGRVKLYLLDTNLDSNPPEYRDITDQLYGGDVLTRIRQEIVLGLGGLRALKAMGLKPTVYHMNEGHSAFLALERIRVLMADQGLSFAEAFEASRQNNVFTTHTSVPAGFDLFDEGLLREYFGRYCEQAGIGFQQFLSLGRPSPHADGPFSMAIGAIQTSAWRNAVSVLHGDVSREMFQHLWPELPTSEVPITSVTNGVHLPGWLSPSLGLLYDQYLQPDWLERWRDPKLWAGVADIPDTEVWDAHRRRKRRLIQFVRERCVAMAKLRRAPADELRRLSEVLEPEVLTIGFARRFATYKRATLLYRDMARLKRILNHSERPVQIIVAGKAHPKDMPGKSFIREIAQMARDMEISHRLVFVEDYSLQVARELVQGVDLWLNTPRRGEEACGTSGMKAAVNGVLNFSVLDGWFDEAYEQSGGWAIGDRVPYSEDQDDIHASGIYSTLENEIVPLYYQDRERGGVPEEWVRRMKQSIIKLSPWFSATRQVAEYDELLYQPARAGFAMAAAEGFTRVRQQESWMNGVRQVWDRVRVAEVGPKLDAPAQAGQVIPVSARVDLAGLKPADVRVEALAGPIGGDGHLESPETFVLNPVGDASGPVWSFAAGYQPSFTGRIGISVRVTPNHNLGGAHNTLTRPCHALIRWG
jgi:glycogen phosphorylase